MTPAEPERVYRDMLLPNSVKSYLDGDPLIVDQGTQAVMVSAVAKGALALVNQTRPAAQFDAAELSLTGEPYTSRELSTQELSDFEASLGSELEGFYVRGQLGCLLRLDNKPPDAVELGNGSLLSGAEQQALYIYTTQHYLLMNGVLDEDDTSINMWLQEQGGSKLTMASLKAAVETKNWLDSVEGTEIESLAREALDNAEAFVSHVEERVANSDLLREDMKGWAQQLTRVAASAVNKLPKFEGLLYRGQAVPNATLEQWQSAVNGDDKPIIIYSRKFFSCSTRVDVAEGFARDSAVDYMKDLDQPYVPVLSVFESKSAKGIADYSSVDDEEEYLYAPGQAFELVEVDRESIPGLAIAVWRELS